MAVRKGAIFTKCGRMRGLGLEKGFGHLMGWPLSPIVKAKPLNIRVEKVGLTI